MRSVESPPATASAGDKTCDRKPNTAKTGVRCSNTSSDLAKVRHVIAVVLTAHMPRVNALTPRQAATTPLRRRSISRATSSIDAMPLIDFNLPLAK